MRRKKFKPNESLIKNLEDGDRIMLKEGNVEEINIKKSPLEEKIIEKKIIQRARKDELWTNKKSFGFQQRLRIAIAYTYEHVYGELHPDQWKSSNLVPKIIKHLKLSRSAHPMV